MAARELRYEWFNEIMDKEGFDKVAVAHNMNDRAETMLINMARGTGLKGLAGMQPVSDRVIRPLLFATRNMIRDYCIKNNVDFREDRSNSDTKYTRNKIRHKVIPVLEEINPAIINTLAAESDRFTELNKVVEDYIKALRTNIEHKTGDKIIFKINDLASLSENRTILFELFKNYGLNNMQVDNLRNILKGRSGSQVITGSHRIVRNRNELILIKSTDSNFQKIVVDDVSHFPGNISVLPVNIDDKFKIIADPLVACLDAENVKFPVVIRKWSAGDAFYPLGMKNMKKLSDYFIDRKYSIPEKEEKLVLESQGNIVWIIGDRIDDRFKIQAGTKKALILKFTPQ